MKSDRIALCFAAGIFSYLPDHYLAGILGNAALPSFAKQFMSTYRTLGPVIVDLVFFALPIIFLYAALAYLCLKLLSVRTTSALLARCIGWLVPAMFVLVYGQILEGKLIERILRWPHVAIVQFAPLIGFWAGFCLGKARNKTHHAA